MKKGTFIIASALAVGSVVWWSDSEDEDEVVPSAWSGPVPPSVDEGPIEPRRPLSPPVEGVDEPFSLPDPEAPAEMESVRAAALEQALAFGHPRPGEVAFRASVGAFMEHNRQFAEAQAQQEGLSLDEVEDLTAFGFEAQLGQRWSEVEEVLGEPVSEAAREAASTHLHATNRMFKDAMRGLVASGAPAAERQALIDRTRREYWAGYDQITGMNRETFDRLLMGDAGRDFAGQPRPTPAQAAEQMKELPGPEPVRPEEAPPAEPSAEEEEVSTEGDGSGS